MNIMDVEKELALYLKEGRPVGALFVALDNAIADALGNVSDTTMVSRDLRRAKVISHEARLAYVMDQPREIKDNE